MNINLRSNKSFLGIIFFITLFAMLAYLIVRITLFIISGYNWYEGLISFALILAELFILLHAFGYFLNIYFVRRNAFKSREPFQPSLTYYPPIAIVVASYKEPIDVLRDTLICFYNITYPNKQLYFLDDTRYDLPWDTPENKQKYRHDIEKLCESLEVNLFRANWHGAKAGMINDFLQFLAGNIRPDFDFHQYQKNIKNEKEKYIIIFDADMNAFPDFAEELVTMMEENPKLAFVQTPQYYTNFEKNRVARAAGVQQAIFYEYICEGKSLKNAMFCCGTNVLFRIEALMDVGGMDEESVTEDFATSLKLHRNGWHSIYVNKVLAFGMGPEDLGAFFKQQFRWAIGTIGILRKLIYEFVKHPRQYSLAQWWEYFLSGTHYLIGWAFFIMIISPIIYILFNIPSFFAMPSLYFLTYMPYIAISSFMFFWTILERQYPFSNLLSALLINIVSFPVFMKASFYGLIGKKVSFGITPKGGANILSFRSLIPQILAACLCAFGATWGILRLYYEREPFYAFIANIFWIIFNFITISYFLYLNHSEEKETP
jgi:cellulose synthase (UDP-forming)